MSDQPGKVQAIGIMLTVAGGLACMSTLTWLLIDLSSLFVCCLYVPQFISPVVAVTGLLYGIKCLQDPYNNPPPKWLAILMICEILSGNMINMVLGIIVLVFLNDPEVQVYWQGDDIDETADDFE